MFCTLSRPRSGFISAAHITLKTAESWISTRLKEQQAWCDYMHAVVHVLSIYQHLQQMFDEVNCVFTWWWIFWNNVGLNINERFIFCGSLLNAWSRSQVQRCKESEEVVVEVKCKTSSIHLRRLRICADPWAYQLPGSTPNQNVHKPWPSQLRKASWAILA